MDSADGLMKAAFVWICPKPKKIYLARSLNGRECGAQEADLLT